MCNEKKIFEKEKVGALKLLDHSNRKKILFNKILWEYECFHDKLHICNGIGLLEPKYSEYSEFNLNFSYMCMATS